MLVDEDHCLSRLTTLCLALPEARREDAGPHAAFRVRTRTFAYYLNDHHGDGMVAVSLKTSMELQTVLIAADPARFYRPAYLGPRGWIALRLDTPSLEWAEVAALVTDSYRLVAPKRLAARVAAGGWVAG